MVEVRKANPAIRKRAADQSLARPVEIKPDEAKRLAEKGYRACLEEGLSQEYAEQYRQETEELLMKKRPGL